MSGFVIDVNAVFIFREKKFRIVAPIELCGKRGEAPTFITDFHING